MDLLPLVVFFVIIIGYAVYVVEKKKSDYQKRFKSELESMNGKSNSIEMIDPSPIKLKKGESLIAYYENVQLGRYQNDGRVAGHGVTVRIPIAKGVSYRAGAGRVAASKSWQFNQTGTLYITTKGLFFNGSHTNTSISYDKMSRAVSPDGRDIFVDKFEGKDVCFRLQEEFPVKINALLYAFSTGGAEKEV